MKCRECESDGSFEQVDGFLVCKACGTLQETEIFDDSMGYIPQLQSTSTHHPKEASKASQRVHAKSVYEKRMVSSFRMFLCNFKQQYEQKLEECASVVGLRGVQLFKAQELFSKVLRAKKHQKDDMILAFTAACIYIISEQFNFPTGIQRVTRVVGADFHETGKQIRKIRREYQIEKQFNTAESYFEYLLSIFDIDDSARILRICQKLFVLCSGKFETCLPVVLGAAIVLTGLQSLLPAVVEVAYHREPTKMYRLEAAPGEIDPTLTKTIQDEVCAPGQQLEDCIKAIKLHLLHAARTLSWRDLVTPETVYIYTEKIIDASNDN